MQALSHNPTLIPAGDWQVPTPRWIHALAVVTVLVAMPLLFLGAEVTTKGVGMADQRSLVNPLQAIQEFVGQTFGFQLEHSHRLAGWLVGFCGIALAASLWLGESRRGVQWLGTAACALIGMQGVLGIFRVQLNAILGPNLAWVHGSFAPIVFAALVSVAWVTSSAWISRPAKIESVTPELSPTALRRWSIAAVAFVYLQVVLGGMMRHQPTLLAARLHLLGAFLATSAVVWLVRLSWNDEGLGGVRRVILGLLAFQVLLGIESWFSWTRRFFLSADVYQDSQAMHWVRSGHYVVGTLLFAATVIMMLQAHRGSQAVEAPA